jgi:arsenical pump membrane protein
MSAAAVWLIAAAMIACVLFRPGNWPEAVWAVGGAGLLVATRLISLPHAGRAIAKGADVYLFLTGMMLMAELARREGVFDWLAGHAVAAAGGSCARLYALVYCVGILVTVFLSNDATAVVLTPAVYAAVRKAGAEPRPHLFACAFIANAASFVLPISNPANLVLYDGTLPPLALWLEKFIVPSVLSIAATFAVLRWLCRDALRNPVKSGIALEPLSPEGVRAVWGVAVTGAVLMAASAMGRDLGLPTCIAAIVAVIVATRANAPSIAEVARSVSWSVLPFVAGLFVMVEALDSAGALAFIVRAIRGLASLNPTGGSLGASFGVAVLSNVMNNLPSGLLTSAAIRAAEPSAHIVQALLVGVDLGPNLSVTGSLATVLWLIALRREGLHVSGWSFLKFGALVMPPALLLAALAIAVQS